MLHSLYFFFFNDTATTEIYTLSLHDALPIYARRPRAGRTLERQRRQSAPVGGLISARRVGVHPPPDRRRSEEHTSELQSQSNLVCRLLLEKKKQIHIFDGTSTRLIAPTRGPH